MTGIHSIEDAKTYDWVPAPDDCAQVRYVLSEAEKARAGVKSGVMPGCKKAYVMSVGGEEGEEGEDEYLVYLQSPCNSHCKLTCREQYP